MARINIHAQLAYYGSAMTEVFCNTRTDEDWDWDAWHRNVYTPTKPKCEWGKQDKRIANFLHKVADKRNLLTHYARVMGIAPIKQLTKDILPGYIYLAERIYREPAFFTALRICAMDPADKELEYRNQSMMVTNVYRTEDPLHSLTCGVRETVFQILTDADREFVSELKAYLAALNTRGTDKKLLPCTDPPWDMVKRKNNVITCLQIVTEAGLPKPSLQAVQQRRMAAFRQHMKAFTYTKTAAREKPLLPSKFKFK